MRSAADGAGASGAARALGHGRDAARATDSAGVSVPVARTPTRAAAKGATAESAPAAAKQEPGEGAKAAGMRVHISAASGAAARPGALHGIRCQTQLL